MRATILDKVARLPITRWNYIAEGSTVQHVGPVSQDFYAAFRLGPNQHTITMVDADGVALAAIQGLHLPVQKKDARIAALEQQVSALQSLRGELAALRATVAELANNKTSVARGDEPQ